MMEMVNLKKGEEMIKHTTPAVIILSFDEIILPLPGTIKNAIYQYYRDPQPYTKELQTWFGDYPRQQHDYSPQFSKIFTLRNIEEYYPGVNVDKLITTDYFKSLDVVEISENYYTVETLDIKELLKHLKNNVIPIFLDIDEEVLTNISPDFDCDL